MTRILALVLVVLFALSVTSISAVASCGVNHCKVGDKECDKRHKGKSA